MANRIVRSTILTATVVGLTILGPLGCASKRPVDDVWASGRAAYDRGDYQLALQEFSEVAERLPFSGEAQYDVGRANLGLGRLREASEHLWIAYDMDPTREERVEAVAQALEKSGERQQLFKFLNAQCQQPGKVSDYLRLGRYAAQAGDADQAEQAFLTAARLDMGKTVPPQLALADFYGGVGDKLGELTRLRMALYLAPADAAIAERIRALGEVPGPSFALTPAEAR